MRNPAEWPPAHHLPHDFAERERAYAAVDCSRRELDVVLAERNIYRHEYHATRAEVLAQIEHVEARLDALHDLACAPLSASGGCAIVIHPETIALLQDALDQLDVIRQDTEGDFAHEDARFADQIDALRSAIADWIRTLN